MLASCLVLGALLGPQRGPAPDFAGVIGTPKMRAVRGTRRLLAVLWDPRRPDHSAPSREEIERLLFGKHRSVAGWFRENSGGRLRLESAGVFGWYAAKKPAEHYWGPGDPKDADGDGFVSGHVEKWTEAIRNVDRTFDFARFDRNRNRVLEPSELSVLFVIPQNTPFGTARQPANREVPSWAPLVVDGVTIPVITEAYAGAPPNLGLFAHELSHQILDAPDMYRMSPFRAGTYSLMDVSYATVHLDPFEKLKLGWLRPRIVSRAGEYRLRDVETSGEALILYDPKRGPAEYFIVENRWRAASAYDEGLPDDGLAVWHILEDPAVSGGDWGRQGIRLLRANGGAPVDDARALYGPGAVCAPRWADGSPSGFEMELRGPKGRQVRVLVRKS